MRSKSSPGGFTIKIAISGKGGVGKTTLAGTLARLFARDGYNVIAIDADPDMNLASALGVAENPRPITDYKEMVQERASAEFGMFKLNPKVDDVIEKCGCVGPDGVKLAVMGTIDTGGSGCMCPETAFLRALLRHVILREKDLVILDMEAGIEHLGRGTTRGVDVMIAVVEPGLRSVETLERIKKLASDLGIGRVMAVINKAPEEQKIIREKLAEMDVPVLGMIPFDRSLMDADLAGKSPLDVGGPGVEAIKDIKVKLEELFGTMAKEAAEKGGKAA
ncbi:MAG TPA: AAA family ATPase [Methanothrix sp.]|nr:AAA family ATPase [Methanothrix sp.]